MLVVNTTSPKAGSTGRTVVPANQEPSSSKTKAGRSVIRSPRILPPSLAGLWLGGRGPRGWCGAGRGVRRAAQWERCAGGGCVRRGGAQPLLQLGRSTAPRDHREEERERQEDPPAPPGKL